jgi:hypothetical protein
MGSSFFSKAGDYLAAPIKSISLNPAQGVKDMQDPLGNVISKSPLAESPTFQRWVAQSPGYGSWAKNVFPATYGIGQSYVNRNQPGDLPAGSVPGEAVNSGGPYSGVAPSMSQAQTGYNPAAYAQAAKAAAPVGAANTQQQSRQNAAASIWG